MSMTKGSAASARATPTRCCCPPDSCSGIAVPELPLQTDTVEQLQSPLLDLLLWANGEDRERCRCCSATVRCRNSPPPLNDVPHLAAQRGLALEREAALPSQVMRPAVGSSIRLTIRSVVVLPQPEGPTITVIWSEGDSQREVDDCRRAIPECLADRLELNHALKLQSVSRTQKTLVASTDNQGT